MEILFEVFLRPKRGMDHKHVGSLYAINASQALQYAAALYTRRGEGSSIWVVRSADISASQEEENSTLVSGVDDKVYRHPTFYPIDDDVKHL